MVECIGLWRCACGRVSVSQLASETETLNLGKGHSDYMPPSVITEALKQVACSSDPSIHQYTRSYVSPPLPVY